MSVQERMHVWLEQQGPYGEGLTLLRAAAPASPFLSLLQRESPANRNTLQRLLTAHAGPKPQTEPATEIQTESPTVTLRSQATRRYTPELLSQALPPDLQTLDASWRRRYKVAATRHRETQHCRSDHKRKTLAFEILEHYDFIHEAWEQIDYYREHGHVKPAAAPEPNAAHGPLKLQDMTLLDILRHRMNIGPNIVKNRKRLKSASTPEQVRALTDRIAGYEQQISAIEAYLTHAQAILRAAAGPAA